MGIIKAITGAVSGALADQWLEVIEAEVMSDTTVCSRGIVTRRNGRTINTKGTADVISNGSVIHVYPNQFMLLLDGGRIVDYTGEEGYYTVDYDSAPSLLNGDLLDTVLAESFSRFCFGGIPSDSQRVYFINLQEIKGIKFGTRTPVNYFDCFYNAELFLRAHGTYSIKITDPMKFFMEAVPKNRTTVDIKDINEQYMAEFLEAFQTAVNQYSADGQPISFITSKSRELGRYMATILDEEWSDLRGLEIQSVGIQSISYDEASQELINLRNQGAMLSDPHIRQGYIQGAAARGVESAGANAAGAMQGFMGYGMASQNAGGFVASANTANAQPTPAAPVNGSWNCSCGACDNTGSFCPSCGAAKPQQSFCSSCGANVHPSDRFCSSCGHKLR